MGQVRAFKPRVKVGAHWDPNEKWAREPKLSGLIDLRERSMTQEQYDRRARELMIFAAGALVGIFGTVLW